MARTLHYPNVDNVSTSTNLAPLNVLAAITQVDGAGSGLDADTVDGHNVVQQGTGSGQDPNTDIKLGWNNVQQKVTLVKGAEDLGGILTRADLDTVLPFTGVAYNPTEQLTDAATIAWDLSAIQTAEVTLTANRILGNPTNGADGLYFSLHVKRNGAYLLSFGSNFKGISGIAQSNVSGAIDHFVFRCSGSYFELVSFKANVGA